MEFFTHINELRLDGWRALRTLVLASERTTLWAPSASYLAELREAEQSLPTPEEVLWYVECGHVRILAREWWLRNDAARTEHGWGHAREWTAFDDSILQIWKEDQRAGRTGVTARVVAVGEDSAWSWARSQVESGAVDLANLEADTAGLPGYREKLARLRDPSDAPTSLLRDARNHALAFRLSGADRNVGTPSDLTLASIVVDSLRSDSMTVVPQADTAVSADELVSTVDSVLARLRGTAPAAKSSPDAFECTQSLLGDAQALRALREWVRECDRLVTVLQANDRAEEVCERLAAHIRDHAPDVEFWDWFVPRSPIQRGAALVGIALATVGALTGDPTATLSAATLALTPTEVGLRKLGWLKEDFAGARWPFYVASGSGDSKRKLREGLLVALGGQ